jgi:hypothetical protein
VPRRTIGVGLSRPARYFVAKAGHPESLAAPNRKKKKLPINPLDLTPARFKEIIDGKLMVTKLRTTRRAHEDPGSDEEGGEGERLPVARTALQCALQGVWNLRAREV